MFWVFLQICKPCFNSQTVNDIYIHFSSIIQLLQFLSHILFFLEARNKLIRFYTKFLVKRSNFWHLNVLVCCYTANEYGEITGIFQIFRTAVRTLSVNETKITDENTFNRDYVGIKGNHESDNDEKALFLVFFFLIRDPCFNHQTVKDEYPHFSSIIQYYLVILPHFLFLLETKNKLI